MGHNDLIGNDLFDVSKFAFNITCHKKSLIKMKVSKYPVLTHSILIICILEYKNQTVNITYYVKRQKPWPDMSLKLRSKCKKKLIFSLSLDCRAGNNGYDFKDLSRISILRFFMTISFYHNIFTSHEKF